MSDVVDEITQAWSAQLPDLDVAPMAVFSRLYRLADHVDNVRAQAFARHDLTAWQFDVLAALRRAGQPYELTPGQLVAQTRVSSGTMTNRIDRLVERGLVDRRGSDQDRRIVLVRLTPRGQRAADAAVADLLAHQRALLAPLSEADSGELADLLRTLLAGFEAAQRPPGIAPGPAPAPAPEPGDTS